MKTASHPILSALALALGLGLPTLSGATGTTPIGCNSGTACLAPSQQQADQLFGKIEQAYPGLFVFGSTTSGVVYGTDMAYLRTYPGKDSIPTGLATYRGGVWYQLAGTWHYYGSLDTANQQFCGNACWNLATSSTSFTLSSTVGTDYGTLPNVYSCDGAGIAPPLAWSNAPSGTKEFALMMTTIPVDGSTKWNWVLYGIPATATGLEPGNTSVGIAGIGSHGTTPGYQPPCSQGPGDKLYTFTLYALSAAPALPATGVTGETLTQAIAGITLGSATLNLNHARP